MSRRVRLKPAAELDVADAHSWYEEQKPGLGDAFARDLDRTLSLIAEHPEALPNVDGEVRRALLRRFPYGAFFVIEAGEVAVLAVMHSARDPRNWPSKA